MDLVLETGAASDLEGLGRAWSAHRSFAFAHSVSPVAHDWWQQTFSRLPAAWREGHFALLTSGSTGTPKLIVGEKGRTLALVEKIHAAQRLDAVRSVVLALPLSYSYSFVNQWLWSVRAGVPLVHTRGLADPARLLDVLSDSPASMLCLVGSLVPLLRGVIAPGRCFDHVQRLNFAGGPFPQASLAWLREVFPHAEIFNNYGCTEALPRIAVRPAADSDDAACIGHPLPGIELRSGAGGSLCFRSPHSAVGIAAPEGPHTFADGEWIATGDLGDVASDGRWHLQGRASEVFKRYGEKVSLTALLAAVRGVWPASAAFYMDSTPGEPAHVLALSPAPGPDEVRALLGTLRKSFRRAHWPVRIESLPAIPLLPNGKPDARAIAADPARQVVWRQF